MIRVKIIVNGRVQDVGYRTIVKQIARGLGIKGMVRNAEGGSVEMFCETDRKTLEEFKKMIDIKSPPEDLFGVNVESIDEYSEGTKNYVNPPGKFEYFHIDYLNEDLLKTSVERAEIGIFASKGMHKDLKKGQNDLMEEQRSIHQDMNKRFDWVAEKYGDIDIGINSIKDDLGELKSMGNDVKEMKNLFAKLVNHIVKE